MTEIIAIPAITAICFLVGLTVKATPLDNKWIPSVVGIVGGGLGIAAMYIMPGFPATDFISAFAVGLVSGWAATGANETVKQLKDNPPQ